MRTFLCQGKDGRRVAASASRATSGCARDAAWRVAATATAARGRRLWSFRTPRGIERRSCNGRQPLSVTGSAPTLACTTSAVFLSRRSGPVSASETMPHRLPPASTTGTRRTCFGLHHVAAFAQAGVAADRAAPACSSHRRGGAWTRRVPWATIRTAMSRSVTTPIGLRESSPSTTGIWPQSLSSIICATSRSGRLRRAAGGVGRHHALHVEVAMGHRGLLCRTRPLAGIAPCPRRVGCRAPWTARAVNRSRVARQAGFNRGPMAFVMRRPTGLG